MSFTRRKWDQEAEKDFGWDDYREKFSELESICQRLGISSPFRGS